MDNFPQQSFGFLGHCLRRELLDAFAAGFTELAGFGRIKQQLLQRFGQRCGIVRLAQ
jgi:hypothetical protein